MVIAQRERESKREREQKRKKRIKVGERRKERKHAKISMSGKTSICNSHVGKLYLGIL